MRNIYVVCYDICDAKRLRRIYKALRGFGDHLQLSVFRCELSLMERAELIATITPIVDHDEDQVLVVNIGPADGRSSSAFEAIGRRYISPERTAIIV